MRTTKSMELALSAQIDRLGESISNLVAERDRYKEVLEFVVLRASYGSEIQCRALAALKQQKEGTSGQNEG